MSSVPIRYTAYVVGEDRSPLASSVRLPRAPAYAAAADGIASLTAVPLGGCGVASASLGGEYAAFMALPMTYSESYADGPYTAMGSRRRLTSLGATE